MKQVVILSGKGGTGKTSVAAAFAHLEHDKHSTIRTVLADADVDAANLELVLQPDRLESNKFTGGAVAIIERERCQDCGICEQVCRFEAIFHRLGGYSVDPINCEGCAACVYQCPENAIHMETQIAGNWYRSETRFGSLFHADLFPAQENSGKLVTAVKQHARLYAQDNDRPLIIVDGPPGIGCPVISAAAGADLALIVTEPTVAGIHDLCRTLETTKHFRIPTLVIINKADLSPQGTKEIEVVCVGIGIEVVGHIPFDLTVTEAMIQGQPVTCYHPEAPASQALARIWQTVLTRLESEEKVK